MYIKILVFSDSIYVGFWGFFCFLFFSFLTFETMCDEYFFSSNCILFTSVADTFFIYSLYVYSSTFRQNTCSVKYKNMHLPNNIPQIISNSRLNRTNNFLLIQIYIYIFFPTFAANSHLAAEP